MFQILPFFPFLRCARRLQIGGEGAVLAKKLGAPLDDFPNLTRWRQMMKERPAVQRAIDLGKAGAQHDQNVSNNTVLFNQGAGHLRNQ